MVTPAYQIVVVRPANFVFAESWNEALDALRYGFAELGIEAPVYENRMKAGLTPIIFGVHHIAAEGGEERLPADTVIYNLEQLLPGYPWYTERYLGLLQRFTVWDFHGRNVTHLHAEKINSEARHVPVGYVPQMSYIEPMDEDIDVLFYGILTERRKAVLEALLKRGMNVAAFSGIFGAERDRWIARAKVVLNLHQEAGGYFEALRVMHLMANRKAVVTECDAEGEIDARLLQGLRAVPYAGLVQACKSLLANDDERRSLAARGYEAVRHPALRMSAILRNFVLG